ncbi:MAG TPA: SLOG family protein [Longimicrobium sp.]|nr:SLOG family protein [Longimicrobium sp.]
MTRLNELACQGVLRLEVLSRVNGHVRVRHPAEPDYVDLYVTRGTVMKDGRRADHHHGLEGALMLLGIQLPDEEATEASALVARVQQEEPEGKDTRPPSMETTRMIIAGTGHRPHKLRIGALNGYHPAVLSRLTDLARAALQRRSPTLILSGMALGWDTALVQASLDLGIPFDAYLPFAGQELRWPTPAQRRYHELLAKARRVIVVSEGGYEVEKMHFRNTRMVDDSDFLLALWDGFPKGGTFRCVEYANQVNRAHDNLWRFWIRHAADRSTALLCAG